MSLNIKKDEEPGRKAHSGEPEVEAHRMRSPEEAGRHRLNEEDEIERHGHSEEPEVEGHRFRSPAAPDRHLGPERAR